MTTLSKQVDQYVGERIRHRRTTMGMTQERLASSLGISYQQVQKYETGSNRVSAGRLYEIAQKLEVHPAYFYEGYEGLEQAAEPQPKQQVGRNRSTIELVRHFSHIDNSQVRTAVVGLLRSLSRDGDEELAELQASLSEAE